MPSLESDLQRLAFDFIQKEKVIQAFRMRSVTLLAPLVATAFAARPFLNEADTGYVVPLRSRFHHFLRGCN